MPQLRQNLDSLRERIARAARDAGRDPATIRLIAVSKTRSAEQVAAINTYGQTDFGENYLQEALAKIQAFSSSSAVWHFIGPVQSNKTRDIAANFDWVHSVARLKIARRLSAQRPEEREPLQVCLQVNIDGQDSKSGVSPDEAGALAHEVAALPNLRLRGLMAIPAPAVETADQRRAFADLRRLRDRLNADGLALDSLSMGMTDDLEAAIAEGATMVRVGTALFGPRR